MVLLRTAISQPDIGLLPNQQKAYQEEQQARDRTWQVDAERGAMQLRGELAGERATIEAQLAELHHCKSALKTERCVTVDLTNARAQARDITAAINHEGPLQPTFIRASQIMATVAALLGTLPTSSTSGVDWVYHQLKDILGITATQQAESPLQHRTEVSILSPGCSKASR
jgi:hypothetical protein